MKKIGFILVAILSIASCKIDHSATVEAWSWTFNPIRDVYAEVEGVEKLVPGNYPYYTEWEITWSSGLFDPDTHEVSIRIREIAGSWSNFVYASVSDEDILYVDIYDTYFEVNKSIDSGLVIKTSNQAPDIEELKRLKQTAGE